MKKKTNNKEKLVFIIGCLLILSLIVVFSSVIIKNFKPIYKIEDRTKNIIEKKKQVDDKILGWLRVQGTNIDYPIIYNDYFKNTDVGSLKYDFVWSNAEIKKSTNRMLIVGHNILNVSKNPLIANKNHSRFEQLLGFIYPEVVEKNKYIQYTVNGKNYLYKIFSVSFVDDGTIKYYKNSYSKNELEEYIKQSKKDSYFNFDVEVNNNDKLITLITCTRMFGNDANKTFKIDARLVRKGEIISNYNVTEKSNYKKIKKIMKGDDENEKA